MFVDFLSCSKIFFIIDSLFLLLKQPILFHPCKTQFCLSKIKTQCKNQLFSTMENLLKIVEEPSSAAVDIDADKLKFFTRTVKIWDPASLSLKDYQELSVGQRSSILRNYYGDMSGSYSSVSSKFLFLFCLMNF